MLAKDSIPFGFCHCGCGQRTRLARQNYTRLGWIKGQPIRFIRGHQHLVDGKSNLDWLVAAIHAHGSSIECLLWPFFTNRRGYGQVFFEGKLELVHRLAFYLKNGRWPLPHGLHECDTPACFNAGHVFEGTNTDNIEDSCKKFRRGRKLTAEIVATIRRDYVYRTTGHDLYVLGSKYGVSPQAIRAAVTRKTWKFVP